jgi:hypothetical protein
LQLELTIYLMHLLGLEVVGAGPDITVVEFVQECGSSEYRPWESGDRMEPKTVNNQRNCICNCGEEDDGRKAGPRNKRKQSHLVVTFLPKSWILVYVDARMIERIVMSEEKGVTSHEVLDESLLPLLTTQHVTVDKTSKSFQKRRWLTCLSG